MWLITKFGLFLSGVMLAGFNYSTAPVIEVQPQSCPKVQVMLWDVDDIARLYVNGTKVFEAIWRHVGTRPGELKIIKHGPGNSGWQVINQYLKEGTNELTFEEYNHAGCCSAALWWQVARGQEIVDQDRFRRPDSSQGKKYSKTIKYEHTCNPPIKNAPMGNVPVG